VFIFESKEERDRWQLREYGHVRNGFRTENEPEDDRPLLVYHDPPFADRLEQATYEAAVAGSPIRPGEGPFSYMRRISGLVTQERKTGAKTMPRPTMTRRQVDDRLQTLRAQAADSGTQERE
jgi:hypothetical protein